MNICVFCASSEQLTEEFYTTGYKVGQLLAENGHALVFGGYSKGIMGAVAKGVQEHGGKVISVIPKVFYGMRENFEAEAEVYVMDTMSSRKDKMIEIADAFVSLPGGVGTFDELFQVFAMNLVGEMHKPIILLLQGETQKALKHLLETAYNEGMVLEKGKGMITYCDSPEAVVEALK